MASPVDNVNITTIGGEGLPKRYACCDTCGKTLYKLHRSHFSYSTSNEGAQCLNDACSQRMQVVFAPAAAPRCKRCWSPTYDPHASSNWKCHNDRCGQGGCPVCQMCLDDTVHVCMPPKRPDGQTYCATCGVDVKAADAFMHVCNQESVAAERRAAARAGATTEEQQNKADVDHDNQFNARRHAAWGRDIERMRRLSVALREASDAFNNAANAAERALKMFNEVCDETRPVAEGE